MVDVTFSLSWMSEGRVAKEEIEVRELLVATYMADGVSEIKKKKENTDKI